MDKENERQRTLSKPDSDETNEDNAEVDGEWGTHGAPLISIY